MLIRELGDLERLRTSTPVDASAFVRQLELVASAALRVASTLASAEPPPPREHVVEILAAAGRRAEDIAPDAVGRTVTRAFEGLEARASALQGPFLRAHRGIVYRDPTPLDVIARHAIAELLPIAADGGAFGLPTFDLPPLTLRPFASNEHPDEIAVRLAGRIGESFASAPIARVKEREGLRREHANATSFNSMSAEAEALDDELERKIAATYELDRQDHAAWSSSLNLVLRRVDAALAVIVDNDALPMLVRALADQVRRHLRGMRTLDGLDLDAALDAIEEHTRLRAPASDVESTGPLVRMRVSTARGIPARSRDGRRYTTTPIVVEVTRAEADRLLADDGLDAREDLDGAAAARDAKLAELEAERAQLEAERAQLEQARAAAAAARKAERKSDNPAAPTRIGRESKAATPATPKSSTPDDFGGAA